MEKDFSFSGLIDLYGALLTDRQLDCLRCYYDYDLSLSEIAQNGGISRQAALDAIKKGEAELKKYEAALRLSERTERAGRTIEDCAKLIERGKSDEAVEKLRRLKEDLWAYSAD